MDLQLNKSLLKNWGFFCDFQEFFFHICDFFSHSGMTKLGGGTPPTFSQNNVETNTFPKVCCEIFLGNMQEAVFVSLAPPPSLEILLRHPWNVIENLKKAPEPWQFAKWSIINEKSKHWFDILLTFAKCFWVWKTRLKMPIFCFWKCDPSGPFHS